MKKALLLAAALPVLLSASAAGAQPYPVLDKVAVRVIAKYQNATCDQLWAEKAAGKAPPGPMMQRAITMLQQDASMRAYFFAKVSAPIVNKMFQCGMIP